MVTTTKTVDIQDADLTELLALVREGTEIILAEGDKPLARLVPAEPKKKRILGLHAGMIQTSDDFDEPLPDEFWLGKE